MCDAVGGSCEAGDSVVMHGAVDDGGWYWGCHPEWFLIWRIPG